MINEPLSFVFYFEKNLYFAHCVDGDDGSVNRYLVKQITKKNYDKLYKNTSELINIYDIYNIFTDSEIFVVDIHIGCMSIVNQWVIEYKYLPEKIRHDD
jgi:hypothetical protein